MTMAESLDGHLPFSGQEKGATGSLERSRRASETLVSECICDSRGRKLGGKESVLDD